ncbi:PKD domain-containing protein [Blastococcus sp. SYSU D00669]
MALLAVAGAMALVPGTASADSAPLTASAATPATVTADALPTVQIDGVAWAQAVVGDTVYVGGAFSSARPAGAPAGTNETPRANLLAYDIRTGELLTSFAHELNGQVLAVAASPDGSRVYVAGDFTEVDGQVRRRVAAFDTATGALVAGWAPNVNSQVRAIAATDDTVYLGGSITAVGGVSRSRLAAVTAADGALLPWAPVPGVGSAAGNTDGNRATSDQVMALVVTGGGSQVVAAGRFDSMNGTKATGVAALDPVTGATRPFAINQKITNQGINSAVYSLTTSGDLVIGTAYDYYGPGNLEGSFVARADGGAIVEVNDCRGDSYASYVTDGVVYVASHTHDCEAIGGFVEQNPRVHKFGTAYTLAPTGTLRSHTLRNSNFVGSPSGSLLPWFPTMTPGTYTGQGQAGWTVSGNGDYVVYGGEFPRVNGVGQQGLVRYAVADLAPNAVGPEASGGLTPVAASPEPGKVTLTWRATSDADNENLTYRVHRDGEAAPVHGALQASTWYRTPTMSFTDTGVAGSTHRYVVTASDAFGNTVSSAEVSVDVVGAATAGSAQTYGEQVRADGATSHWRLGETSGSTAAASVGSAPLTVGGGVTKGVSGALTGDANTAFSFNGTATATLSTQTAAAAPTVFTEEAWFQTTSTKGGRIMGYGNRSSGTSTSSDRQVYLDNRGRVNFGISTRVLFFTMQTTVTSTASFNDGTWHHVAASVGANGMALYVDGELVGSRTGVTAGQPFTGYLRVGSDDAMGGSDTFTGRIDEVAVYGTALSAAQVRAHHTLGVVGKPANAAPRARFTQAVTDLTVAFDASASTDGDGTVASYAWSFGDGATGTGATASHTYGATGTYTAVLTVTDDKGATGSISIPVSVVANKAPAAGFSSAVADRTVRLDGSASTDPDGSVAAYAWDFGDGTTGTGATASHTYDADGSYTVRLTVTDDEGATSTTTRTVAVAGTVVHAVDTFGRTTTGGLGTADTGGAWTSSAGATRQSVTPGAAELRLDGAGQSDTAYLGGVSATTTDVRTSFALSAAPTGNGTYVYVTGRRVDGVGEYRVRVRVAADGSVGLALSRLAGTTDGYPGGETIVPGLTWTAGTVLNVRVQTSGTGTTTVQASVWAAGTAEPATPSITRTDGNAALQVAGAVGLTASRPGGTTAATVVRVYGFRAITPGAGAPANSAPTAAFVHGESAYTVTVDAAASTDAEGALASYAWDFGDGSTANGATAEHTYAAAGTYPVRLTVTDSAGTSSVREELVTVSAATNTPVVLAADAFGRTVTGGLGTADTGGAWTASNGGSRQSVEPGTATLRLDAPGNLTGSYLGQVAETRTDVLTTVSLSAAPTGGGTSVHVTGRRVGTNLEYRARLRFLADGTVRVAFTKLAGSAGEALIGAEVVVPGLTHTPGTPLSVRVEVSGTGTTSLAATVWPAGSAEPTAPTVTRTDGDAALQAPGGIGLSAYLSGSATTPLAVRFTALAVTPVA